MRAQDIRNTFSNYFIKNGHVKIKSSSLVPHNDPTLLFANAGMNQFKDYFTGKANASDKRAITIQKCVRAGGKHNDLENVGFTARHHTFFEMMGNFSFGDYFKKEAIKFAWTLLTEELKIPKEKLLVTVHDSDDEAYKIWNEEMGIPHERIFKLGDATNFWEMGDVGPCGPCTEIFYDHGPDRATGVPEGHQEIDDEGRYVEIWNNVFMQFEKYLENGEIKRKPLPKPSVDTGAGLERLAAVLQGKYFNYDTDVFEPIMKAIGKLSGKDYYTTTSENEKASFRVVADHIRSSAMLITDGVIPSNEGRGYVLRRIIRRAVRHLSLLGLKDISFYKLVPSVFEALGEEYADNMANASLAEKLLKLEEDKFRHTLDTGLSLINEEINKLKNGDKFSGETAFKLYDTFGFPMDLTEVILREKNIELDAEGFETAMKRQKELSKKGSKFKVQEDNAKVFYEVKEKHGPTKFVGYETSQIEATLLEKVELEEATYLIFDQTPFYADGGGQVGDRGGVLQQGVKLVHIEDTVSPVEGLWAHQVNEADSLIVGERYTLLINEKERELTKRNHSATHLLQAALIKTLGDHIKQAGSAVGPDRLRFDFTHPEALKPEEIKMVEELVNDAISRSLPVCVDFMSKDEASAKGAMALFGEKYGDEVRVLSMGDFSMELCGGTHVNNTQEIGLFKIIVETSLASGIRRIEAITSTTAIEYLNHRSSLLAELEKNFGAKEEKAMDKVIQMQQELKEKNKLIETLNDKLQNFESANLFNNQLTLTSGMTLAIVEAKDTDQTNLRKLSDIYVDKFPKGILLLFTKDSEKASFILKTNKNNKDINCSNLIKAHLANLGGRGGGKPDMVQGSVPLTKIDELAKLITGDLS